MFNARFFRIKAAALCLMVGTAAFATSYTWTGGGDRTSWVDEFNWDEPGYPNSTDDSADVNYGVTITLSENVDIDELELSGVSPEGNLVFTTDGKGEDGWTVSCNTIIFSGETATRVELQNLAELRTVDRP